MAKLTLANLANLSNETTAVGVINANSDLIETALENTLSRDGTSPNSMSADLDLNSNALLNMTELDMNSNNIINLTDGVNNQDAVTFSQLNSAVIAEGNVPLGGTTGQYLRKSSSTDFATAWDTIDVSDIPIRDRLTANRTYYVSTTGSNSATGLTVGAPFQTVQYAVAFVSQTLDLNGYSITINLADGTYSEDVVLLPYIGRGTQGHTNITIQGNATTPSNVVVSGTSTSFQAIETGQQEWVLKNLKVISLGYGVLSDVNGWIVCDNVVFGACTTGHVLSEYGGVVEFISNYTINGASKNHLFATHGGKIIYLPSLTVTLSGTLNFSDYFAGVSNLGTIVCPSTTFTGGTITGQRWSRDTLGTFFLGGTAANSVFPGSTNGSNTLLTLIDGTTSGNVIISAGNNAAPVWSSTPTLTLTNCTGLPVSTGISGLGTNIATALAVNVGTAGAPVINGGVLGTPSSGTLSSCTGLPVSSGVSGFGTGVATALAVNIGSAGAFVTFNGALGSPSSAGTLPAYTLGGTISGGGNQVNNVIIGTSTPLAGTFTTLTANSSLTVAAGSTIPKINLTPSLYTAGQDGIKFTNDQTTAHGILQACTLSGSNMFFHWGNNCYFDTSGVMTRYNTSVTSCGINYSSTGDIKFYTGGTGAAPVVRAQITSTGECVTQLAGALLTTATTGDLYIPTCAGTPTGVPTGYSGTVAMRFDTTNNKLYFYNGGWKKAQVTAVDAIYA